MRKITMNRLSISTVISLVLAPAGAFADSGTNVGNYVINADNDGTHPGSEGVYLDVGGGTGYSRQRQVTVTSNGTTIEDSLRVNGGTTVSSGGLSVTGGTDLNSGLNVDGATMLDQTTISGTTSINGGGTAATSLGANGNTTSLLSNSINVGHGAYATDVNVGSATAGTNIDLSAGGVHDNSVTMSAGGREGLRVYTRVTTEDGGTSTAVEINATAADPALKEGADIHMNAADDIEFMIGEDAEFTVVRNFDVDAGNSVDLDAANDVEIIAGDKAAIRADRYYVNVGDSDGNIGDAGIAVAGNGESDRFIADTNGLVRLVNVDEEDVAGNTAAMVVQNPDSTNYHGLVVQQGKTTLSGGTNSASLTLDDRGATFSDPADGRPIQVHGVADGTAPFDAVNVRQLYSGLSTVLAATPEIQLEPGKTGFGFGVGAYGGYSAVGLGFGHMYGNGVVLTGSVAKGAHSETAARATVSWTW